MKMSGIRLLLAIHSGIFSLRHSVAERERGATAVEYGLLVALIAAVIIATVIILGGQVNAAFTTVSNAF